MRARGNVRNLEGEVPLGETFGYATALRSLTSGRGTFTLQFDRYDLVPDVLRELASAYPSSHVVGCSTSGEIHGQELHDDSISVAVASFEHSRLRSASASVGGAGDSYDAGRMLADRSASQVEP